MSVHAVRMPLEDVTADSLDAMAKRAVECAELLSHADVDVVAYACTTGSLLHGHGFDAELEAELAATADCPAVATALSVERAFAALDCERIALATPYVEDLTQREVEYLNESGYEVVAVDGRGVKSNTDIGSLASEDAYRQARTVVAAADDPDAVFVSCTNYPSLSIVDPLERDLGLPVVTSNAATLWDALRVVSVDSGDLPGRLSNLGN
jgi:maleate isomerase